MSARVGDIVDDYCTRCHRLTNHTVASMQQETIAHTACRTCGFEHAFKHARQPAARKSSQPSAFDQVLAGILGNSAGEPETPAPRRKRK